MNYQRELTMDRSTYSLICSTAISWFELPNDIVKANQSEIVHIVNSLDYIVKTLVNNKLHNDDGPAYTLYYKKSLHREKEAYENKAYDIYFINNLVSRTDGPAITMYTTFRDKLRVLKEVFMVKGILQVKAEINYTYNDDIDENTLTDYEQSYRETDMHSMTRQKLSYLEADTPVGVLHENIYHFKYLYGLFKIVR